MVIENERSGCYSKIELRPLTYYSDSWELNLFSDS